MFSLRIELDHSVTEAFYYKNGQNRAYQKNLLIPNIKKSDN